MDMQEAKSVSSEVIALSWDDIFVIVNNMADNSKKYEKADVILAIQRGGLIPGVILSHMLNIRDFIALDIKVTKDDSINSQKNTPILNHNNCIKKIQNKRVILVDDIVGSGTTYRTVLQYIMQFYPLSIQSYICVVNKVNWDKYNDDFVLSDITYIGKEANGWIKFPWESNL